MDGSRSKPAQRIAGSWASRLDGRVSRTLGSFGFSVRPSRWSAAVSKEDDGRMSESRERAGERSREALVHPQVQKRRLVKVFTLPILPA